MPNFVDQRNQQFIEDRSAELCNLDEIILSVRKHARLSPSALLFPPVSIILISTLVAIVGLVFIYMINGGTNILGICVHILLLCIFFYMIYNLILGIYVAYQWPIGIRDEKIVANLRKQGKITTGIIVKVQEGSLSYEYHAGGEITGFKKVGNFITDKWERFHLEDNVFVLYVYNVADCLL